MCIIHIKPFLQGTPPSQNRVSRGFFQFLKYLLWGEGKKKKTTKKKPKKTTFLQWTKTQDLKPLATASKPPPLVANLFSAFTLTPQSFELAVWNLTAFQWEVNARSKGHDTSLWLNWKSYFCCNRVITPPLLFLWGINSAGRSSTTSDLGSSDANLLL